MAITRYRHGLAPWRAMDQMAREWDRLFGESAHSEERTSNWLPAVNVEETKNEVILTAELPGLSEENVQIELENNVLTIRGHKETTREGDEEGAQYHVWERQFGSFHRSFSLPRTVAADQISASFEDGVLHVHMPKAPESKGRTIEIRRPA